jgi:predicted transcriptional regulator
VEICSKDAECRAGSVLVVDHQQCLTGIFTGRDAVRALAEGKNAEVSKLVQVMTPNPITIASESRAIDALRGDANCDRGLSQGQRERQISRIFHKASLRME